MPSGHQVTSTTCKYVFLDFDINSHRRRYSTAAAFVDATDTRYGFSSKDIQSLGGSELSRLEELIATDHEWSDKDRACGGIEIRPPPKGSRIVLKLYWDTAPLACENFATLCLNGGVFPTEDSNKNKQKVKPAPIGECGKPLTYRESIVHRIVPGFIVQAGDFVFGNGSGGESIFGKKAFKDERAGLLLKHDRRGILSCGNSGKNSNTSQFFITFDKASQCDGKHVIFGEVVSGFDVLDALEQSGTKEGTTTSPVIITDCGIYQPLVTPSDGWWFERPDADAFEGSTPVFVVRPRIALVVPTEAVGTKFVSVLGESCSIGHVIIHSENDKGDGNTCTLSKIMNLLESFTVDVVIVAPACPLSADKIELPPSWSEASITGLEMGTDEIIIKTKPIDVLSAIRTKSWIARRRRDWKLE